MILNFPSVSVQIKKFVESLRVGVFKNRINRVFFYISIFLVIASSALFVVPGWRLHKIGEAVAIRYNIYFGVDLVGSWSKLLFYPLFAFCLFVVNIFGCGLLYKKERLVSYFIAGITPVLLMINLVTFIFVLLLNFEFIEK